MHTVQSTAGYVQVWMLVWCYGVAVWADPGGVPVGWLPFEDEEVHDITLMTQYLERDDNPVASEMPCAAKPCSQTGPIQTEWVTASLVYVAPYAASGACFIPGVMQSLIVSWPVQAG